MLREFSLLEVQHADNGRVAAAFDKLLEQTVRDCFDRPGVDSSRTVTMTVTIKPVMHNSGDVEAVKGIVKLAGKCPAYETPEISFAPRKRNGKHVLVWNDLSEGNPSQRTLDELEQGDESP